MAMSKMPEVIRTGNGRFWSAAYDTFRVKVYVPDNNLCGDVINYGFGAPYLIVLEEKEQSADQAIAWAEECGLAKIALQVISHSGSMACSATATILPVPMIPSFMCLSPVLRHFCIRLEQLRLHVHAGAFVNQTRFGPKRLRQL